QMAEKLESYGPENPEVKRIKSVWETNNIQIDNRCSGILIGMRAKRDAEKARLDNLLSEVGANKTDDIEKAIERRPYFQAKRDLESLQYIREKLTMRVIQEKIDSAIPKSAIVDVLDKAEPGLRPVKPNKFLNI